MESRTPRFSFYLTLSYLQDIADLYFVGLEALSKFLTEHKRDDGPYILGSQVTYADLILVAFLESSKRTSEEIFRGIVDSHMSIDSLYKACSKWLERSSY